MKLWLTYLISFSILAAGGGLTYVLNDYWNNPVMESASKLGTLEKTTIAEEGKIELKEMIRTHQKSVVSIEVITPDGGGYGSGFLYNDKGDIVTNAHVVLGAIKVKVKLSDTSIYNGKVIGLNEEKDIAIVRVEALADREPLSFESELIAEIGDKVIAFGSPLGLDNTVTTGIISGVDRDLDIDLIKYRDVYQISAPIAPGNSGGPLILESSGKVIGINSAGNNQGNIGFSIPLYQVMDMLTVWSDHPDEALVSTSTSGSDDLEASLTVDMVEEDAQHLVNWFYESVNAGDYVTAYRLLGSDWQTQTSYETFREGYLNTASVYITNSNIIAATESSVELAIIIEAWEIVDGSESLNSYSINYLLKPDNGKFNIIKGTGKKI